MTKLPEPKQQTTAKSEAKAEHRRQIKLISGGLPDQVQREYAKFANEPGRTIHGEQYQFNSGEHSICVFYSEVGK